MFVGREYFSLSERFFVSRKNLERSGGGVDDRTDVYSSFDTRADIGSYPFGA